MLTAMIILWQLLKSCDGFCHLMRFFLPETLPSSRDSNFHPMTPAISWWQMLSSSRCYQMTAAFIQWQVLSSSKIWVGPVTDSLILWQLLSSSNSWCRPVTAAVIQLQLLSSNDSCCHPVTGWGNSFSSPLGVTIIEWQVAVQCSGCDTIMRLKK